MEALFYKALVFLSRRLGPWFFTLVSGGIAAGYFLCCPGRVAIGVRFYQTLYPHRGRWFAAGCTWRQFRQFTTVFMDRMMLPAPEEITYTFDGWEHLTRLLDQGKGAILLMSHMGNWEVAAHLLGRQRADLRLLLYMGSKETEAIERLQKVDLVDSGVRVIAVDRDGRSPFDLVTGRRFIQEGGVVSMTGDRLWHSDQRSVPVRFLGHEALLPEVPHQFALLSRAPLIAFFACRRGRGRYHFSFSPPIHVTAPDRAGRADAVARSAQAYADLLAAAVRRSPFQWYHFQPFLGKRIDGAGKNGQ
ncbi:MAG: lysophospholipid acyltransferase family protein [Pseudomonadota bacterium]